jgi:hypothetical protein
MGFKAIIANDRIGEFLTSQWCQSRHAIEASADACGDGQA